MKLFLATLAAFILSVGFANAGGGFGGGGVLPALAEDSGDVVLPTLSTAPTVYDGSATSVIQYVQTGPVGPGHWVCPGNGKPCVWVSDAAPVSRTVQAVKNVGSRIFGNVQSPSAAAESGCNCPGCNCSGTATAAQATAGVVTFGNEDPTAFNSRFPATAGFLSKKPLRSFFGRLFRGRNASGGGCDSCGQ